MRNVPIYRYGLLVLYLSKSRIIRRNKLVHLLYGLFPIKIFLGCKNVNKNVWLLDGIKSKVRYRYVSPLFTPNSEFLLIGILSCVFDGFFSRPQTRRWNLGIVLHLLFFYCVNVSFIIIYKVYKVVWQTWNKYCGKYSGTEVQNTNSNGNPYPLWIKKTGKMTWKT